MLLQRGSELFVSLWDDVLNWLLGVPDVDGCGVSNVCARTLQLTTNIRAMNNLRYECSRPTGIALLDFFTFGSEENMIAQRNYSGRSLSRVKPSFFSL
jgi:hypothetical protein